MNRIPVVSLPECCFFDDDHIRAVEEAMTQCPGSEFIQFRLFTFETLKTVTIEVPDNVQYKEFNRVTPEFVIRILTDIWHVYKPHVNLH